MNSSLLVSIVTPSYNQGQFIEATILSVLNQTYKNIQYIIVDGGSTDGTMNVVNKYRDKIDVIIHEKDRGQSDAINKGFKLAKGELVGWINSDDVLYPDCIEKIIDLYNENNAGAIYYGSKLDFIGQQGNLLFNKRTFIPNKEHLLNKDYDVIQPGSFYATKAVENINYVNESIYYSMDLDLWLRLLNSAPIYAYDEKPIAAYRAWEGTKTSTSGIKFNIDIKKTLLKYGCNPFSKNLFRLNYYIFKGRIKAALRIS